MRATLAPVAALLLSMAVLLTGNGLQVLLVPLRARIEDFSTLSIGILGSAYFAGFAAGCLLGPKLIERVGHIRSFATMTAIATAAILCHVLISEPVAWWVLRAASGFCFAVLYVVIESWLNARSTRENRGLVLSLYLIISLTVITVGQLLVTLADPASFTLFAVGAILLSLGAVPVATTRALAPTPPPAVALRLARLYRNSPLGFLGCIAVGLANGAFWSLGPVFAADSGMETGGIALLMSAAVIGGALGQWPLGTLSDRIDRRYVMIASCLGAAVTGAALSLAPDHGSWLLFAMAAAWGAFAFPLYTLSVAHSNDFAAPEDFVEVSAGLLLLFGAGAAAGPTLIAPLMQAAGSGTLFQATMVIHLLLAGFCVQRLRTRAPAPAEEHVTFGEAVQAAMTVSGAFQNEAEPPAAELPR
jgi:MFS family permease